MTYQPLSIITQARNFAIHAHGDQMYGNQPYVAHLDDVARIVESYGETAVKIAYLHDVLEDTNVSFFRLGQSFDYYTAQSVRLLSKSKTGTRNDKNQEMYLRVQHVKQKDLYYYAPAFIVKAADRKANIFTSILFSRLDLFKMYLAEHKEFRQIFYVPGLCDDIWNAIDSSFV